MNIKNIEIFIKRLKSNQSILFNNVPITQIQREQLLLDISQNRYLYQKSYYKDEEDLMQDIIGE